jgi:hypothetical protein
MTAPAVPVLWAAFGAAAAAAQAGSGRFCTPGAESELLERFVVGARGQPARFTSVPTDCAHVLPLNGPPQAPALMVRRAAARARARAGRALLRQQRADSPLREPSSTSGSTRARPPHCAPPPPPPLAPQEGVSKYLFGDEPAPPALEANAVHDDGHAVTCKVFPTRLAPAGTVLAEVTCVRAHARPRRGAARRADAR